MFDSLPATLTVKELSKFLRIGINAAYELVKMVQFSAFELGGNIASLGLLLKKYLDIQTSTCT